MELLIVGLIALTICVFLGQGSKDTKDFNVHSAQGGWVQIAVAAIGALASARAARQQGRQSQAETMEGIREQGAESRRTAAYEAALADYYQQAGKERARKSLGNFARWSSVDNPTDQPYYTPTAPTMPDLAQYNYTKPKK